VERKKTLIPTLSRRYAELLLYNKNVLEKMTTMRHPKSIDRRDEK